MRIDCSYGVNVWAQSIPGANADVRYWQTVPGQGAGNIPMLTDSVYWWACRDNIGQPPQLQNNWISSSMPCCVNRHNGFIIGVFMDWSSRRIGLKELWTLKWHRNFDTTGPFTIAGGVQPGDWPEWMRSFKDY